MSEIRRWLRVLGLEHGSQGMQAAAAALAAALIIGSLIRVADTATGTRITNAMNCAAAVLTGGGGCTTGTAPSGGEAEPASDDDGSWFGDVWDGITSTASDLWDGITSTASDVWNGFTSFVSDVWDGITSAISDLWNGFTSFVSDVWDGIAQMAQDIWNGIVSAVNWVYDLIVPTERPLTPAEIEAAKQVLGEDALDWDRVRVRSGGYLDAAFWANGDRPFTTGYVINVPDGDTIPTSVMVHELMHTYQYEKYGWDYIRKAIIAQNTDGYDYGGPDGLEQAWADGKHFADFNVEQQGQIVQDYYELLENGGDTSPYAPYIQEVQDGNI